MPSVKLGWGCRQQVENKGSEPIVPMQGVAWDQGLSDGEEENILEMESGQMVSSPSFATNKHLSIESSPTRIP